MAFYLLNSTFVPDDLASLSSPPPGHRILEAGELDYAMPLAWLTCFRAEDLLDVRVTLEDFDGNQTQATLRIPCTRIETALERLNHSLPRFERLMGDHALAKACWSQALSELGGYRLPYLTLDPSDRLGLETPDDLNESMERMLAWDDAWVDNFKGNFAVWTEGVRPIHLDSVGSARADEKDALWNTLSICASLAPASQAFDRSADVPAENFTWDSILD